jgi:hypothetical protein
MQLALERLDLTQLVLAKKEAIAPLPSHLNPLASQQNHDKITAQSRPKSQHNRDKVAGNGSQQHREHRASLNNDPIGNRPARHNQISARDTEDGKPPPLGS